MCRTLNKWLDRLARLVEWGDEPVGAHKRVGRVCGRKQRSAQPAEDRGKAPRSKLMKESTAARSVGRELHQPSFQEQHWAAKAAECVAAARNSSHDPSPSTATTTTIPTRTTTVAPGPVYSATARVLPVV